MTTQEALHHLAKMVREGEKERDCGQIICVMVYENVYNESFIKNRDFYPKT